MTNTEMLEQAIMASGYKKAFLANKIGLTPAGFYNCLNNRAEFKASQIQTLCDLLGLDMGQRTAIFFGVAGG